MSRFSEAIETASRESSEKEAGQLAAHLRNSGVSNDLGARLILREQFSSVPDAQFDGILDNAEIHEKILTMLRYGG